LRTGCVSANVPLRLKPDGILARTATSARRSTNQGEQYRRIVAERDARLAFLDLPRVILLIDARSAIAAGIRRLGRIPDIVPQLPQGARNGDRETKTVFSPLSYSLSTIKYIIMDIKSKQATKAGRMSIGFADKLLAAVGLSAHPATHTQIAYTINPYGSGNCGF
jgi:hypothetical protein